MMIDPRKIIDFLTENDVRITVKDYGKNQPQIMLTAKGANIPLNSAATGLIIDAIVALMTAHGIQTTFHKAGQ